MPSKCGTGMTSKVNQIYLLVARRNQHEEDPIPLHKNIPMHQIVGHSKGPFKRFYHP
jgi:UDP-N-acetyl-D-mannosaminuronic acid transferase (WecB/TagA/CpsF family)